MGYAMGARVAYPDRQVCVLMGDGAAGFSLMDAESLARQRLPVVIVVGNNGIWGLEKHPMRAMYGYDVAADLQPGLRYDDVVRALGGAGETVSRPATWARRCGGPSTPGCRTWSTCSPTRPTRTPAPRTWPDPFIFGELAGQRIRDSASSPDAGGHGGAKRQRRRRRVKWRLESIRRVVCALSACQGAVAESQTGPASAVTLTTGDEMDHAIWAEGLVKRFGETTALDGVDLAVRPGTVVGLLGPNGAGKTTTVRVLTTLLRPDAGHATVAGYDVVGEAHQVRQLIGLTGQYAAVDENLTGVENLVLIGRLLGLSRADGEARARELLEQFHLTDAGGRAAKTYSGGMRRRLDLAASLVGRPPVLYLDEPTTGLDPRARIDLWGMVRELVADGATVLLTTQYLEEADELADEIVVVDHGRVIAQGTPDELKIKTGAQTLAVRPAEAAHVDRWPRSWPSCPGQPGGGRAAGHRAGHRPGACCRRWCAGWTRPASLVAELALRSASLDEVFLALTGHPAEDEPRES